jgi:hypothetical protein
MATKVAADCWEVQGRQVRLPVRVRDAVMATSVFQCSARAARQALAGSGYEPFTMLGRALSTLICVQYRDGDLDTYDEVGIMVVVRGPDGTVGPWTAELPVTQGFTMEAGRDIWGLPKWIAQSRMTFKRARTTVHLEEDGAFILAGVLRSGRLALPKAVAAPVVGWSTFSGPAHDHPARNPANMVLQGLRVRPGGAHLVLGDHRMASLARSLGMEGRALMTMSARRVEMSIDGAESVVSTRSLGVA